MRYSFEFKLKAVELLRQGILVEVPEGIKRKSFGDMVHLWDNIMKVQGPEGLKGKSKNISYSVEDKIKLIKMVLSGQTLESVALKSGILPSHLWTWVKKYRIFGASGLKNHRLKHKTDTQPMKNNTVATTKSIVKLSEEQLRALPSEVRAIYEENLRNNEEILRLQSEISYIKTENEIIKKRIALREKNFADSLKAKKQRSSKN